MPHWGDTETQTEWVTWVADRFPYESCKREAHSVRVRERARESGAGEKYSGRIANAFPIDTNRK